MKAMVNNKYIIVDNYDELTAIEGQCPELRQTPLILLSDSFNLGQLASLKERGYQYFDDAISDNDAKNMSTVIHDIMWNWFRDQDGKDLSLINGLSLGLTFSSSMEILLNSIIKYEVGLGNILKTGDEITYVSNTDDVFLAVISGLKEKLGLSVNVVDLDGIHKMVFHGRQKLKLDPGARKRDLDPYFKIDRRAALIRTILKIVRKLKPSKINDGRVLLYSAGKLDEFISIKTKDRNWVLPFSSLKDIFRMTLGKISTGSRFYFTTTNNNLDEQMNVVILALENNLSRIKAVNHISMLDLMRKYIFKHTAGAISFYENALEELISLKPNLVIVSSDVIEPHLIIAQAAKKAGIKTALLPHGLDDWGYKELRTGEFKVIDYCLAYGKKHVLDNIAHGVTEERIKVTSFPYFSKFIPCSFDNKRKNYKKALILTPDYINMSPASKSGYFFRYLRDTIKVLKENNFKIIGVKSRGDYDYLSHDINEGCLTVENEKIRWFTGYTSFPDVAKEADIVIGNPSTALIEAGLMGIDYYVICQEQEYDIPSLSCNLNKIMHVAHSIGELRDNILTRRVYRGSCSVNDLIDLRGISSREELFCHFDNSVSGILSKKINSN